MKTPPAKPLSRLVYMSPVFATVMLALALVLLPGCAANGGGGSSSSSADTGSASSASEKANANEGVMASSDSSSPSFASGGIEPASADQLVVETDVFKLVLPEEWAASAAVTYDGDSAQIHLKDHSELPLLTVTVVDGARPRVGGDIGNGMFRSIDLPDGRRLEMWSTNWLWLLSQDAVQRGGRYDYLGDSGKLTLISLTYGEEVALPDLSQIGAAYYDSDFLAEYYAHMDSLVSDGFTLK